MKYDFRGYVSKYEVLCTDGRTIKKGAFKHCDGWEVPLVWQHVHDDPSNVLGKVTLQHKDDGLYGYASFNETQKAKDAKLLLAHGDVNGMSIYATRVKEMSKNVQHGDIQEVSLVLSRANPGALIENLSFAHADGTSTISEEDVLIFTDSKIENESGEFKHADDGGSSGGSETMLDIFNTLTDKQKDVVFQMLAMAGRGEGDVKQSDEGDDNMSGWNAFEPQEEEVGTTLSHTQIQTIFEDAQRMGSLKESVLAHADEYGIKNIEILFPDARKINGDTPEFIKRDTSWVDGILNGVKHTPFSRIKTVYADITADEARARGYTKGKRKKEEVFPVMKRTTSPTTIYKKQKLDRDDIIDITDFDVVRWLKAEMRMMLNEEIARALLVGDGRAVDSDDKINEENIRPVASDDPFFSMKLQLGSDADPEAVMEAVLRKMEDYEGTGEPVFYTTRSFLVDCMLLKDKNGRRIYETKQAVANAMGVRDIVTIPIFKGFKRTVDSSAPGVSAGEQTAGTYDLVGMVFNLSDYTIGADKGGQIEFFDDFDIDYNQFKYLMETRISAGLTLYHSAIVVEKKVATTTSTPSGPIVNG